MKAKPSDRLRVKSSSRYPRRRSMQVQPYLQFDGRCEEAIEFYKSALGAKVETLMRFKDAPDPTMIPLGFSLTITAPNKSEADRLFHALGKGGAVQMPLAETFFSPRFGMVADRFGVSWMIVTMRDGAAKAAQ